MRLSRRSIRPKLDIETASDEQWELACRRAAALQNLLSGGAGRSNVTAAAKEQGISAAMMYRLLARFRRDPSPSALLPGQDGLHHPDGSRESLAIIGQRHKQIWVELRSALSAPDASELKARAAFWDIAIRDELDFYWLRNTKSTG